MQNKSNFGETPMSVYESKKTSIISETTCSRDTNDCVPPNNTILSTDSASHNNDKGCSRELFGTNIDSYNSTSSSTSVSGEIVGVEGRKKKKKGNKKINKKNEKQSGKGKSVQPNPCLKTKFQNNCKNKFTEDEREIIFEECWNISDRNGRRDYLISCMEESEIKRKRVQMSNLRKITRFYYFTLNGRKEKICQQYLLKTLNITQRFLSYSFEKLSPLGKSNPDSRGKGRPKNKTDEPVLSNVYKFIESLPAVQSHYCRSSTKKKYLPKEFESIERVFRLYKSNCESNGLKIVSSAVFRRIFREKFNLGFHLPKKDKCNKCTKFKNIKETGNLNENELQQEKEHAINKEQSKEAFIFDQELSKCDGNFLCVSFDLQKVLSTPYSDNMNLYYSRKYSTYNCTVYESGSRNSYCYLWGEIDGLRGSNEIVTCIFKYLTALNEQNKFESVALYCDSCAGQNKNRAMMTMIEYGLMNVWTKIKEIKITYLLPGHTYMPVDSVHSVIERCIKKKTIWGPSEWPTIIRNARIYPKP